jgi:hypothetical protein
MRICLVVCYMGASAIGMIISFSRPIGNTTLNSHLREYIRTYSILLQSTGSLMSMNTFPLRSRVFTPFLLVILIVSRLKALIAHFLLQCLVNQNAFNIRTQVSMSQIYFSVVILHPQLPQGVCVPYWNIIINLVYLLEQKNNHKSRANYTPDVEREQ